MASIQIWSYRDTSLSQRNLSGLSVEALDGSIGKIDEATNDVGGSYIVVDTGPWIFGKKVLLPAGVVERVDRRRDGLRQARRSRSRTHRSSTRTRTGPTDYRDRYRSDLGSYYGPGGKGWHDDELV